MKRQFKQFLKTVDKRRRYSTKALTQKFQKWANKQQPTFRTHTTKHTIRKWLEDLQPKIKWYDV